jgi:phospholipid-binding lipoprotein MlaA
MKRMLLIAAAALGLTGCATTGAPSGAAGAAATAPSPADPWEGFNRKVFAFNDAVDNALVRPLAETYRDLLPTPVRTGVSNVLRNINDVWSAANHLLQGKLEHGVEMGFRVLTNTTFGLGGVLDPATEMGLQRRPEDFGQTLGVWGFPNGPFVMLPLLGPSTVRDTTGLLADRQVSASSLAASGGDQAAITALEVISLRASLLDAGRLLDQVALDRYSFLRDSYLQRRLDAVYDGAPPFVDEFADEPDSAAAASRKPAAQPAAQPAAKPTEPQGKPAVQPPVPKPGTQK